MIEEIEKKMMGDAIYKSEQEKKNELFEYNNYESEFDDMSGFKMGKSQKIEILNITEVHHNLREVYDFYSKAYIQPKKKYKDFDAFQ